MTIARPLNSTRADRLADSCVRQPGLHSDYLEHHAVLPVHADPGGFLIATWKDALDLRVLDDLRIVLNAEPIIALHAEDEVRDAIQRVYAPETISAEDASLSADQVLTASEDIAIDDLVHLANEAPVVKIVNVLLIEALDARASDVHLESRPDGLRTRFRIDGVLQDGWAPPVHLRAAIVSRLKIMADLDIAERRMPQDGRIRLRLRDRDVDVRVSTVPTLHGESVVLRLLDKDRGRIGLSDLGMSEQMHEQFRQAISQPHGIVLATGPTGSGKTTSLYAAVDAIRTGREKILTVEDPVEYELPGVPQLQVNEKAGLTFSIALRSLLRQDPDVMLVGEIRDAETAEIATQAALTGHLVLSTLHTNDAVSALTRLLDLDVPAYLVASTVEAVLAQRLVRLNCRECAQEQTINAQQRELLGKGAVDLEFVTIGRGCPACRSTGFLGRTGMYELLIVKEELRAELGRGATTDELRQLAISTGMRTLRDDGLRLIRAGLTAPEEVLRVTRG